MTYGPFVCILHLQRFFLQKKEMHTNSSENDHWERRTDMFAFLFSKSYLCVRDDVSHATPRREAGDPSKFRHSSNEMQTIPPYRCNSAPSVSNGYFHLFTSDKLAQSVEWIATIIITIAIIAWMLVENEVRRRAWLVLRGDVWWEVGLPKEVSTTTTHTSKHRTLTAATAINSSLLYLLCIHLIVVVPNVKKSQETVGKRSVMQSNRCFCKLAKWAIVSMEH